MISDFFGHITGFLEKDFLFGSFLPAVVFNTVLALTLVGVLGTGPAAAWVDSWTPLQTAATAGVAGLALLAFAYVLAALRTLFMRLWSGETSLGVFQGFLLIGRFIQRNRYLRLEKATLRPVHWPETKERFINDVKSVWNNEKSKPSKGKLAELEKLVDRLGQIARAGGDDQGVWTLKGGGRTLKEIVGAFDGFDGNELTGIYSEVKKILEARSERNESVRRKLLVTLDRSFGALESIRPTDLGNVVESFHYHSTKRYNLEGRLFFPHLQNVMSEASLKTLSEQRMLLDFSLAMATLSFFYAVLALIAGPWLWHFPLLWGGLAAAGAVTSLLFYRVGVIAAKNLGELVRAAYDLGRRDLMKALGRPQATSLAMERGQWEELSQLTAYGVSFDFKLRIAESDE